jgi:hypothetical protein
MDTQFQTFKRLGDVEVAGVIHLLGVTAAAAAATVAMAWPHVRMHTKQR